MVLTFKQWTREKWATRKATWCA